MKPHKSWQIAEAPSPEFSLNLNNSPLQPLVAHVLYNRGIRSDKQAYEFLHPLEAHFSDPMQIPGTSRSIERIFSEIRKGGPIGVFGDFDVDGLTGTAIMVHALRHIGGKVMPYIPHREHDGHGLSIKGIQAFRDAEVELIVTVDTGTTAHKEIGIAKDAGIDVIVTDHHLPDASLPPAYSIVNSTLSSEGSQTAFAGAGIAFKVSQALLKAAGQDFPSSLLSLSAIGTIADSVSLTNENRLIVSAGLHELEKTNHIGLRELIRRVRPNGTEKRLTAEFIAYQIVPRLNAPGRLGDAEPSLQLLITEDKQEAQILTSRIDALNIKRRQLSASVAEIAYKQMKEQEGSFIRVIECKGVPVGLLGPIAGRMAEEYGLPVIAYTTSEGLIRASARSIPELNIHEILNSAGSLLERSGGHSQAAGFTAKPENINAALEIMERCAAWAKLKDDEHSYISIDAEVSLDILTPSIWRQFSRMEPFGTDNPSPLLAARRVSINNVRSIGNGQHIRLVLDQNGSRVGAIGFNLGDAYLGSGLVDIVFELRSDAWRGRTQYELGLKDIRAAS